MKIATEQSAEWFGKMHPPGPAAREMYRMAAKALRPFSREQVEKAWRGDWIAVRPEFAILAAINVRGAKRRLFLIAMTNSFWTTSALVAGRP